MEILRAHGQWYDNANPGHRAKPEYSLWLSEYNNFKASMLLAGNQVVERDFITQAVTAFNIYKDIIDQWPASRAFNAQSKFHSTIHEEFWVYIAEDVLKRRNTLTPAHLYLGSGNSLQGLFFHPASLNEALSGDLGLTIKPKFKDRDFMMALKVPFNLRVNGDFASLRTNTTIPELFIPLVTIECKQYIDKTMLDNALSAATKLKHFSPYTLDIITIELNKLSDVNISGSGLDGFYVLRKQKLSTVTYGSRRKQQAFYDTNSSPDFNNTFDTHSFGPKDTVSVEMRNAIDQAVVLSVYNQIKAHLEKDIWHATVDDFISQGVLVN